MSGPGLSALRDWPCSLRTLSSSFKGDFSVLKKATVQVHGFSPLNMLRLQLLWLWSIISSFTCQFNTRGQRNSSRRNSLHPIGLWGCWWPVFLIPIWCESVQPTVGLNRWTWAIEERCLSMSLEMRESEALLHRLCSGSCLKVPTLAFLNDGLQSTSQMVLSSPMLFLVNMLSHSLRSELEQHRTWTLALLLISGLFLCSHYPQHWGKLMALLKFDFWNNCTSPMLS